MYPAAFSRRLTYSSLDGFSGVSLSDCGRYRYDLWRRWDPTRLMVKFIMLNPSTADHKVDDPTIRKCMKYARTWGYGGIKVVNLFAYRATDPKKLKALDYAEMVGPCNNEALRDAVLNFAGPNIAAWGQGGKLCSRGRIVREEVLGSGVTLQALKLSKDGTPWHPLYLRDNLLPFDLRT